MVTGRGGREGGMYSHRPAVHSDTEFLRIQCETTVHVSDNRLLETRRFVSRTAPMTGSWVHSSPPDHMKLYNKGFHPVRHKVWERCHLFQSQQILSSSQTVLLWVSYDCHNTYIIKNIFPSGGLTEKHVVASWNLRTISVLAERHRKTKKTCQDDELWSMKRKGGGVKNCNRKISEKTWEKWEIVYCDERQRRFPGFAQSSLIFLNSTHLLIFLKENMFPLR
jgi:hypothetical protein